MKVRGYLQQDYSKELKIGNNLNFHQLDNNIWCIYRIEIYLAKERKQIIQACYHTDEPQKHYAQ